LTFTLGLTRIREYAWALVYTLGFFPICTFPACAERNHIAQERKTYMGTIRYTVRRNVCPHCGHLLSGGQRRFGPPQIRCGRCGAVLQTGLAAWADLSPVRKILAAVEEIILPSWINAVGCTGLLVKAFTQLFLWAIVQMPLILIVTGSDPKMGNAISVLLVGIVGPLLYPALLAMRLGRMIRESQAYTQRGDPPVWGTRVAEEQANERAIAGRYVNARYRILLRLLALVLAVAWFMLLYVFLYSTPLLTAGLTAISRLAGIAMILVHIGGAVVVAELLRCLGYNQKAAYVIAVLTLFFAPLALSIIALFIKHRVSGLISTIKSDSVSTTTAAIEAYTAAWQALADVRSPTAVEPLVRALLDRKTSVREVAASTLGEIGDKRAIVPLIQALKDKESSVRSVAATALGKVGDAQAVKPLNAALKDENDPVRAATTQALNAIVGKA
jgi:hypothetical protein